MIISPAWDFGFSITRCIIGRLAYFVTESSSKSTFLVASNLLPLSQWGVEFDDEVLRRWRPIPVDSGQLYSLQPPVVNVERCSAAKVDGRLKILGEGLHWRIGKRSCAFSKEIFSPLGNPCLAVVCSLAHFFDDERVEMQAYFLKSTTQHLVKVYTIWIDNHRCPLFLDNLLLLSNS